MSSLKVIKYLTKILKVTELTDLLNGGNVYSNVRPTNSDLQDIVINVNFLKDRHKTGVNFGIANINVYKNSLSNGLTDSLYFETIYKKIIEIFERREFCYQDLTFNIDFTTMQKELLQNDLDYLNIRLNVQI